MLLLTEEMGLILDVTEIVFPSETLTKFRLGKQESERAANWECQGGYFFISEGLGSMRTRCLSPNWIFYAQFVRQIN